MRWLRRGHTTHVTGLPTTLCCMETTQAAGSPSFSEGATGYDVVTVPSWESEGPVDSLLCAGVLPLACEKSPSVRSWGAAVFPLPAPEMEWVGR